MLATRAGGVLLCLLPALACTPQAPPTPARLLVAPTTGGTLARTGTLSPAGEPRPALLESASWRVRLPARPLLTFGIGFSWAGQGEAPGWYRLAVRADGREVAQRTLNPRAARGWRDVSLPLDGAGREATLEFDLRFTD